MLILLRRGEFRASWVCKFLLQEYLSIKTPIMKMMKNKVENSGLQFIVNSTEDVPRKRKKWNQTRPWRNCGKSSSSNYKIKCKYFCCKQNPPTCSQHGCGPAAVLPGVSTRWSRQYQLKQNSSHDSQSLIPVNSIPTYNAALDNNPLCLTPTTNSLIQQCQR